MSAHWRIALRYALWVSAGAILAGAGIWLLYGPPYAGSFLYGVAMGLISFVSMAGTVSLMTGRSTAVMMMVGAGSFGARCVFAAVVLGIPAYLGLWPILAMLGGYGAVYLAESMVLLPMMPRKIRHSENEREERKVGT